MFSNAKRTPACAISIRPSERGDWVVAIYGSVPAGTSVAEIDCEGLDAGCRSATVFSASCSEPRYFLDRAPSSIPLRSRGDSAPAALIFRVMEIRPGQDGDEEPVLVVEPG
jgi:hypothetical protein